MLQTLRLAVALVELNFSRETGVSSHQRHTSASLRRAHFTSKQAVTQHLSAHQVTRHTNPSTNVIIKWNVCPSADKPLSVLILQCMVYVQSWLGLEHSYSTLMNVVKCDHNGRPFQMLRLFASERFISVNWNMYSYNNSKHVMNVENCMLT